MKKLIYFIIAILLCSCKGHVPYSNEYTIDEEGRFLYVTCKLVDITFEGETHEYVLYEKGRQGSLSHWEGCKYCKNHNHNNNLSHIGVDELVNDYVSKNNITDEFYIEYLKKVYYFVYDVTDPNKEIKWK